VPVLQGGFLLKKLLLLVPPQFTRVPFPVKALKLLLHELEPSGEAPAPSAPLDTQFDDGVSRPPSRRFIRTYLPPQKDSDWSDEERVKEERFSFLADMMGVGGPSFDEDDELLGCSNDDEDLQKDPISLIDLRVACFSFVFRKGSAVTDDSVAFQAHITSFLKESVARDADGFGTLAGQLSAEEMIVMQRALQQTRS
jgi:hypothetical protein